MELSLDCGSGDLAIQSLSSAFQCRPEDLANLVKSIDLEAIYQTRWQELEIPSDEYLFLEVVAQFGMPRNPTSVYWFHLTRTTRSNDFSQGLMPLGEVLELLWKTLIELAPSPLVKRNLLDLKNSGVNNFHYNLKSPDKFHWGPYAILVREVAFHAHSLSQHDYLAMPEIIEDICNGYESAYGTSIIDVYESAFVPCIVKFRSDCNYPKACIRAALCYVRTHMRGERPDGGTVMCFDGNGTQIPPSSIVSVEYVVL